MPYYDFIPRIKTSLNWHLPTKIYEEPKVNMMAQPKLALSRIKTAISPLPPLLEQQRIVAQVDKLMAYCDELQAAKDRERECQAHLCESAFTVLERSSDDQELSKHWNFCAENFQALEQTPENVSKLRNTILQLAVQGRLTQQRPEDGNARDLLEKIKEAKRRDAEMRRGNGQRIQKAKKLPPIEANEIPFEIPESWEWVRLGAVFEFQYGKSLPAKKRNEDGLYPVYGSNGIVGQHDRYLSASPTIIIGRKGSAGALNKCMKPSWTTDVAYFVSPPEQINFDYAFTLLKSSQLENLSKGIKPGINRNEAYELVVPLPPLPEQKCIVAQVDKLMAYCDQLEAGFRKREEGAGSFCKAVVAGAGGV